MEAELGRLREAVATAEQTAAKDQGMLIRAAEERMAVLDQVGQPPCFDASVVRPTSPTVPVVVDTAVGAPTLP